MVYFKRDAGIGADPPSYSFSAVCFGYAKRTDRCGRCRPKMTVRGGPSPSRVDDVIDHGAQHRPYQPPARVV